MDLQFLFAFTIKSSITLADCKESLYTATIGGGREVAQFKGSRFSFKTAGSASLKL